MAALRNLGSRLSSTSFQFSRTMATAAAPREYHFLVIVPDKPGALQRRLEARGPHFDGLKPKVQSGDYVLGGALLKDVPKDDDVSSLDFWGSTLVMKAESKEKVIETLKADPYTKADVWDWDKLQIYPFRPGWKVTGSM